VINSLKCGEESDNSRTSKQNKPNQKKWDSQPRLSSSSSTKKRKAFDPDNGDDQDYDDEDNATPAGVTAADPLAIGTAAGGPAEGALKSGTVSSQ